MKIDKVDLIIWKREIIEKLMLWFVWRLPKTLIMWCGIRIGAHATTGKYGTTLVPDLTFMDAMKRWE